MAHPAPGRAAHPAGPAGGGARGAAARARHRRAPAHRADRYRPDDSAGEAAVTGPPGSRLRAPTCGMRRGHSTAAGSRGASPGGTAHVAVTPHRAAEPPKACRATPAHQFVTSNGGGSGCCCPADADGGERRLPGVFGRRTTGGPGGPGDRRRGGPRAGRGARPRHRARAASLGHPVQRRQPAGHGLPARPGAVRRGRRAHPPADRWAGAQPGRAGRAEPRLEAGPTVAGPPRPTCSTATTTSGTRSAPGCWPAPGRRRC